MSNPSNFLDKLDKEMSNVDCSMISSIKDINEKFSYEDTSEDHKKDYNLVSCGQDDSYNELDNIYKRKLSHHVRNEEFTKKKAIRALCEACCDLDNPRKREDFYKHLSEKLGVEIK